MILLVAAAIAVAGIAVGAFGWDHWLAVVGWVLAGPIAIGVMAYFVQTDTKKRAAGTYVAPPNMNLLYVGATAAAVIGILVSAVGAAYWVGHW